LKRTFVVENAELSIEALLALVETFATAQIHQNAGKVIVEESHQSLMQPLNGGRYHCKPHFAVGTTYIIIISATQ